MVFPLGAGGTVDEVPGHSGEISCIIARYRYPLYLCYIAETTLQTCNFPQHCAEYGAGKYNKTCKTQDETRLNYETILSHSDALAVVSDSGYDVIIAHFTFKISQYLILNMLRFVVCHV